MAPNQRIQIPYYLISTLEFMVDHFRANQEAFPWIVKLVLTNDNSNNNNNLQQHLLLCTGAAVSEFVAVFPAHCISGNEKSRLIIVQPGIRSSDREFSIETILLHPEFIFKHPAHEHDLAVVKIRNDPSGFGFDSGRIACLPEWDEDPVDQCQVVNFFPDNKSPSKV